MKFVIKGLVIITLVSIITVALLTMREIGNANVYLEKQSDRGDCSGSQFRIGDRPIP